MRKPLVALVGRPNVGKSTFFNRLAGERLAVVDARPGTTRDRLVAEAEWNGVIFNVVDTGGIEPLPRRAGSENPLSEDSAQFIPEIRAQAEMAIDEADAVILMTEVTAGVTVADREVAQVLRRHQRRDSATGRLFPPVLLAVNKSENLARDEEAVAFYELNMGDPFPISAMHGTGTGDLLDALVEALPRTPQGEEAEPDAVGIAIVGRPNVGKSSLLNRLLGEERAIVSPIPGTTRDALDTQLTYKGVPITLIDTAGIRRRGHIDLGVEKWSVLRALRAISRAEVALLVIDATEPFTAQDAHIAGFILDEVKSVVVVVNKWDAVEKDEHTLTEYTKRLRSALSFLDYVPVVFVSAKTGQRTGQILPTALRVHEERLTRVPTSQLNRIVREAVAENPPKPKGNRQLKISYASQVRTDPPTFLFHVNDPALVHFSYERYLENRLRREYGFLGTPLRLSFRRKSER
ncbi:MAG: ribosome biogenesis GTPase Der [Anaerolineales bacterium]